jgi:hypothetical protein
MTIALTMERLGINVPDGSAAIALEIRRNHTGDTKLWHDLRCNHLRWLYYLRGDLLATTEQLSLLDVASSHDQPLDEEILVQVADFSRDGVHASLSAAVIACEQSVNCLRGAYELLAGLFKGTMRDATEESLSRSLKGAEAQLAKLQAAHKQYELPKRPHEIRRTALSYLILFCHKIRRELDELKEGACSASSDLLAELDSSIAAMAALKSRLELLRERSSQKMEENLLSCQAQLDELIINLEALAKEAGKRSGR